MLVTFGKGTIYINVEGEVINLKDNLYFLGTANYRYYDEFTDPVNLREDDPDIKTSSLVEGKKRFIEKYIDKESLKTQSELTKDEIQWLNLKTKLA